MDLEFTINNQTLKRTDTNKPVNWSDNYLTLCFNFESDDWTGLNKYCLLRVNGELFRVELDNDQVTLPVGVLTSDRLIITLYGSDDKDYRITTNMVSIILGKSGYNIEDIGDIPDIEDIYALIESKASTKYVNTQLSLKANITDIPTKTSDLTNDVPFLTEHQSLNNYYTKNEVDELIRNMGNQMIVTSDKSIIQTGETSNITVQVKEHGFPANQKTVNIYKMED